MHLSTSLLFPSFASLLALQAVAVDQSVKFLAKRDSICPLDTPGFFCIFIPPGVSSFCSSTCGSSTLTSTDSCASNSCVCNSNVVSTYASCLQCVANNYKGNTPSIIQPFLDDLVDECRDAGVTVSTPPSITSGSHPTATQNFGTPNGTIPTGGPSAPHSGGGGPFNGGDDDDEINVGLAVGAAIGIGVGVPLGSLLIFGLIGWLCLNSARNRRKAMAAGYYNRVPHQAY